jgi:hypothetical protein
MAAGYKLFWRDKTGEAHLFGFLPERRENTERITEESIINWGRIILSDNTGIDLNEIYFIPLEMKGLGDFFQLYKGDLIS